MQISTCRISPDVDVTTRTVACFIALETADGSGYRPPLLPGAFVAAEIPGRTQENVLVLPRAAFIDGRIFLERAGRAHSIEPRVRFVGRSAIVTEGLEAGERVILTQLEVLYDGMRVSSSIETDDTESGDKESVD